MKALLVSVTYLSMIFKCLLWIRRPTCMTCSVQSRFHSSFECYMIRSWFFMIHSWCISDTSCNSAIYFLLSSKTDFLTLNGYCCSWSLFQYVTSMVYFWCILIHSWYLIHAWCIHSKFERKRLYWLYRNTHFSYCQNGSCVPPNFEVSCPTFECRLWRFGNRLQRFTPNVPTFRQNVRANLSNFIQDLFWRVRFSNENFKMGEREVSKRRFQDGGGRPC